MMRAATAILILGLSISLLPVSARSGENALAEQLENICDSGLAVMPFVNLSGRYKAVDLLPDLYEALLDQSCSLILPDSLRPVLRSARIRSTGRVSRADALAIGRGMGVKYLLIGALETYETEGIPEVALSARILRIADMRLIAAVSTSATGEDFAGLFGVGRISEIGKLSKRVASEFAKNILDMARAEERSAIGRTKKVVIVPFDNTAKNRHAGTIISGILLSALFDAGFEPIEPGLAEDIYLRQRELPTGGISKPLLEAVYRELSPTVIISGRVDLFRRARGTSRNRQPMIEYGMRMLDGSTGRILATFSDRIGGNDSESLFRTGRYRSIGQLTRISLKRPVEEFSKKATNSIAGLE